MRHERSFKDRPRQFRLAEQSQRALGTRCKTPLQVGDIEGPQGNNSPFVLLSGHHDTWYYRVMDNGSANATMLEAVRLLATRAKALRRGLRVCFWSGHSHGRYSGSAWYVDQNWRDLDRRGVAHVNVDSTGGIGATVMTENGVVSSLAGPAAEVTLARDGRSVCTSARLSRSDLGRGASAYAGVSAWRRPAAFAGRLSAPPATAPDGPDGHLQPLPPSITASRIVHADRVKR
jgi:hypothetical protein